MALEPLRTLLALTEVLRPGLTAPSFSKFVVVLAGWIRTAGIHAVTEALVVTGVAGQRHHEAYHRFFSRGTGTRMNSAASCSGSSSSSAEARRSVSSSM